MAEDIRWQQRLDNFARALSRLREVLAIIDKDASNHVYQIALIGAFQFTFELSWKTMKDYLVYNGIAVSLPREVIKAAFRHEIIQDGQSWIDMLEDRNVLAHVYQEKAALEAVEKIRSTYAPLIETLYQYLSSKK